MKQKALYFVVVVLIFTMLACDFSSLGISATATPQPTYTPVPTNTPIPTATKIPLTPGIDTPVYTQGVSFLITSAYLSTGAVTLGDTTLTPNPDRSVLVVEATYGGDLVSLFNGAYQSDNTLYVTDAQNNQKPWQTMHGVDSDTVEIGFFVMNDAGPYSLVNTVDSFWSVDLTPFLH